MCILYMHNIYAVGRPAQPAGTTLDPGGSVMVGRLVLRCVVLGLRCHDRWRARSRVQFGKSASRPLKLKVGCVWWGADKATIANIHDFSCH